MPLPPKNLVDAARKTAQDRYGLFGLFSLPAITTDLQRLPALARNLDNMQSVIDRAARVAPNHPDLALARLKMSDAGAYLMDLNRQAREAIEKSKPRGFVNADGEFFMNGWLEQVVVIGAATAAVVVAFVVAGPWIAAFVGLAVVIYELGELTKSLGAAIDAAGSSSTQTTTTTTKPDGSTVVTVTNNDKQGAAGSAAKATSDIAMIAAIGALAFLVLGAMKGGAR